MAAKKKTRRRTTRKSARVALYPERVCANVSPMQRQMINDLARVSGESYAAGIRAALDEVIPQINEVIAMEALTAPEPAPAPRPRRKAPSKKAPKKKAPAKRAAPKKRTSSRRKRGQTIQLPGGGQLTLI